MGEIPGLWPLGHLTDEMWVRKARGHPGGGPQGQKERLGWQPGVFYQTILFSTTYSSELQNSIDSTKKKIGERDFIGSSIYF